MAKIIKPALVGDSNQARFNWLKEVLQRVFSVEAEQVRSFDELLECLGKNVGQVGSDPAEWSLIFVADDLPPTPNKIGTPEIVKTYFTRLGDLDRMGKFATVLIVGKTQVIDFRGVLPPQKSIYLTESPPGPSEEQGCLQTLDHFAGLSRVISADLLWDKDNRALREQIRALSENRNLSEGTRHLAGLIGRCLDCTKLKPIEVKQLGQGKSGSSVFRLMVDRGDALREEYLLKLSPAGSVWKLESEVRGHLQASPNLTHPGYRVHLPILQKVHVPYSPLGTAEQPNEYVVRNEHWYAVYFDFVGGDKFGSFIDLETTFVGSAKELEEKTAKTEFSVEKLGDSNTQRFRIFESLLDWLCENWYANSKGVHLQREVRQIWDSEDAREREYESMPPYKLTGRSKGWIQSFLDGREGRLGERFFPDWAERSNRILRLVSEDKPTADQLGQLGVPLPVVLSHVHGDLNASNILLWLEKNHPFLIDFPFYQEAGHALQDFARLEVEIKLALMDRQEDSSEKLKAYEYTYSQMPIWQLMEDQLLSDWDQSPSNWPPETYEQNVQFCFGLIQLLRRKARAVQQNNECPGEGPSDFLSEYLPALLYQTVRSIGFPSLSVFKRLLAVYSASSILKQFNCFAEPR